MNWDEFRDWSHKAADWGADYRATLRDRPVRASTAPGDIAALIAPSPPESAEPMEAIFADFEQTIVPGMTHWQHPRFFAYFPANAAPVSVVAEYLVSAMAAQCMLWQTSPAATELETRMIDWLRQALGLPDGFSGVIQDSASSATLAAVLTMRERALDWAGNSTGPGRAEAACAIYCSDQVHTSIDRAIWVSGIGEDNLVKHAGQRALRGMDAGALEAAIVARPGGRPAAGRHHRLRRRHQRRRHRRRRRGLRGRQAARALRACRCRLGRIGDDLPRIPALSGPASSRRIRSSSIRTNGWARSSTARSISCATRKAW